MKQPHLQKATKQRKPCFRCGGDHIPQKCRFKHEDCRNCNSKGHIVKVCKKKAPASRPEQNWRKQPVRYLEIDDPAPNNHDDEFKLFQISEEKPEPSIMIPVKVNGEECSMELDTGASVLIMSEEAWRKRFPTAPLEESQIKLRTYTGEALDIIGQANVQVTYQDQIANLPLRSSKEKDQAYLEETGLGTLSWTGGQLRR